LENGITVLYHQTLPPKVGWYDGLIIDKISCKNMHILITKTYLMLD